MFFWGTCTCAFRSSARGTGQLTMGAALENVHLSGLQTTIWSVCMFRKVPAVVAAFPCQTRICSLAMGTLSRLTSDLSRTCRGGHSASRPFCGAVFPTCGSAALMCAWFSAMGLDTCSTVSYCVLLYFRQRALKNVHELCLGAVVSMQRAMQKLCEAFFFFYFLLLLGP